MTRWTENKITAALFVKRHLKLQRPMQIIVIKRGNLEDCCAATAIQYLDTPKKIFKHWNALSSTYENIRNQSRGDGRRPSPLALIFASAAPLAAGGFLYAPA